MIHDLTSHLDDFDLLGNNIRGVMFILGLAFIVFDFVVLGTVILCVKGKKEFSRKKKTFRVFLAIQLVLQPLLLTPLTEMKDNDCSAALVHYKLH